MTTNEIFTDIQERHGPHWPALGLRVHEALVIKAKEQTKYELPKVGEALKCNGAELLAIKAHSFHPGDDYLFTVVAKYRDEFVTWMYNADHNGCGGGSYHTKYSNDTRPLRTRAFEDYVGRHRQLYSNEDGTEYAHGGVFGSSVEVN